MLLPAESARCTELSQFDLFVKLRPATNEARGSIGSLLSATRSLGRTVNVIALAAFDPLPGLTHRSLTNVAPWSDQPERFAKVQTSSATQHSPRRVRRSETRNTPH